MKKYKIKGISQWIVSRASMFALAYFGFIQGIEWAGNVFKFWLWLIVILYTFGVFSDSRDKIKAKGRSVPKSLSISIDLLLALFLAALGMFFYAALQVFQLMLYEGIFYEGSEKEKKDQYEEIKP